MHVGVHGSVFTSVFSSCRSRLSLVCIWFSQHSWDTCFVPSRALGIPHIPLCLPTCQDLVVSLLLFSKWACVVTHLHVYRLVCQPGISGNAEQHWARTDPVPLRLLQFPTLTFALTCRLLCVHWFINHSFPVS